VGDGGAFVILRFNQTVPISSIAWSRDNGDTNEIGCSSGTCTDRTRGNYVFQYTLATNPAVVVNNSPNPTNGWATLATVQYVSAQPGFTPHLRHRFDFAGTNGPILATGIRFRPSPTNTLDEIEINPPVVATFDAVFGLELTTQDILPLPPKLAFNEISGASATNFWLEIINHGDAPVDIRGLGPLLFRAGTDCIDQTGDTPGALFGIIEQSLDRHSRSDPLHRVAKGVGGQIVAQRNQRTFVHSRANQHRSDLPGVIDSAFAKPSVSAPRG
jgi:hypothetical protein